MINELILFSQIDKRLLLFAMFFLCTFSNCKKEENSPNLPPQSKYVDINNPISITLGDMITDIDTISLAVTDSSLLNDIEMMHIMNDKLYVFDMKSNAIFIFSRNGDFIRKIYRAGQGPQEYIRINSFEIDYQRKRIILSDSFSRRIFLFDEYGNFLYVVNLQFAPYLILTRNEGYFNFYPGVKNNYNPQMENYNIHMLDSCGNFISSHLESQTQHRIDIISPHHINYNSQSEDIWYQPHLSDTVYRIDKDNRIHPDYIFRNKSKYKPLSPEERKKITYIFGQDNKMKEMENKGYLLTWGSVLNLDDYMFFVIGGWDHPKYVYYEKKSGRSITIDPDKSEENKTLCKIFCQAIRRTEGNYFYKSISPFLVNEFKEKLPDGKLKTFLQNNNTPDSNPVIIKYKIKFPEK